MTKNGVYTCTAQGDGATPFVVERSDVPVLSPETDISVDFRALLLEPLPDPEISEAGAVVYSVQEGERTLDGIALPPYVYSSPVSVGSTPTSLIPVWVRPDMPPWPAPQRLTRRQQRLRGAMKAWRRREAAGVSHRQAFAALINERLVLI